MRRSEGGRSRGKIPSSEEVSFSPEWAWYPSRCLLFSVQEERLRSDDGWVVCMVLSDFVTLLTYGVVVASLSESSLFTGKSHSTMLLNPINTDSRDGKRSRSDSDSSTSPTASGDTTTGNSERPPSQPPRKRTHHDLSASTSATPTVPNPRTDPTSDPSWDCLCLVCRKTGHVVEKCPLYIQQWEHPDSTLPPDVEPTRPSPPFNPFPPIEESTQASCPRCSQLDSLSRIASHRPVMWRDMAYSNSRMSRKTTQIPSLGPIRSLRLLSTCSLCRLIFDSSYLTDDLMETVRDGSELMIVTAWTIHRLERDLHWSGDMRGKGPYAKCVYTAVVTQSDGNCTPQEFVDDTVGAIGLIDIGECQLNGGPALGVRRVDPTTPDYCMIKDWLRRCDDLHHTTCRPFVSEYLKQIKLVDVETRQIVMYPPDGCDYIALSYVWGGVEQPSFKLGEILPTAVLATLEDAMVVTRHLGKQYLWADSLCIDQENSEEKAVQIALMSTIYSGAWATIIPLSGRSARSGLPRVGTLRKVVPQLSCEIWGKRLLSVMPTLSQQVSWSRWESRAWTFQEGLLSPRRLFFTNHQVYFECNSVQCCESLDDSNSPFHLSSDEERQVALDAAVHWQDQDDPSIMPKNVIGQGVHRDPFRPISMDEGAQVDGDDFARYLRLVHSYTMRKLSRDADSLNAFSAILTRLAENCYKDGFVEGLPVEDLPRALLWFHPSLPRRRVDFSTWSWAGWEGEVSDDGVRGARDPDNAVIPPLRIWKVGDDDYPELVYNFNPTPDIIKELEKPPSPDGADDQEDVEGSDSSWDTESGDDSDEVSEGRYVTLWLGMEMAAHTGSSSDIHDEGEIDFRNDPVFRFAKTMLEEIPATLPRIKGHELLIEGIVIRPNFPETPNDQYSDSETDADDQDSETDADDEDSDMDDEDDARCFVRLELEGQPKPQLMRFYGHNAVQLAEQQSGDQQEFLLISRETHYRDRQRIYNALLVIDRGGDVANRVGVASLRLDNVKLLDSLQPERKLFKLR